MHKHNNTSNCFRKIKRQRMYDMLNVNINSIICFGSFFPFHATIKGKTNKQIGDTANRNLAGVQELQRRRDGARAPEIQGSMCSWAEFFLGKLQQANNYSSCTL